MRWEGAYSLRVMVLVRTKDGWGQVPLWLKTGCEQFPNLPIVESVSIEQSMGEIASSCTVTVALSYQAGMKFIESQICAVNNLLLVQAGYPQMNKWTPVWRFLTMPPELNITPESVGVTLNGSSGMPFFDRLFLHKKINEKGKRRDLIEKWFRSYGVLVEFPKRIKNAPMVGTGERAEEEYSGGNAYLDYDADGWYPDQKTFKAQAMRIAELADLDVFVESTMLDIGQTKGLVELTEVEKYRTGETTSPPFMFESQKIIYRKSAEQKIKATLVMRGGFNPEKDEYPILSFTSQSPYLFGGGATMGVLTFDISADTKKTLHNKKTVNDTGFPSTEKGHPGVLPDKDMKLPSGEMLWPQNEEYVAGVVLPLSSGREEEQADGLAGSLTEEDTIEAAMVAEASTYGIPGLNAGEAVEVKGIGKRFDGRFLVTKKTINIGESWEETLELRKSEIPAGDSTIQELSKPTTSTDSLKVGKETPVKTEEV